MTPQTLWNRHFLLWLIGSGQSQFGSSLASIALSFLVLHQTGQAGQMAVTLACGLLPNLFMPLAGSWVDRVGVKWPLVGASVVRGLLQLTVGLLALHSLQTGQVLSLSFINVAAFLSGLAGSFASPASSAAVPHLVPREDLARANGLLGSVNQSLGLAGTLLGGLLVATFSPGIAILADGLSFLVTSVLLLFVALPAQRSAAASNRVHSSLWTDLGDGLRLMRRSSLLTGLPFLALLVNAAMAPVLVVTPRLMDVLGAGPKGYGTFLALESLGLILVGALFAVVGKALPLQRCVLGGFALATLAQLGMWLWPGVLPLLGCSLVFGLASGLINVPLGTLIQQNVPTAFLGRVSAVLSSVGNLGMPVTLLLVAPLVDHAPLPAWYGLNSVVMLLGGLVWWWLMRAERQRPSMENTGSPGETREQYFS
ncbi:MFS transporter [Deinococcus sp. UYEF24]